jgi:hypothetical protein
LYDGRPRPSPAAPGRMCAPPPAVTCSPGTASLPASPAAQTAVPALKARHIPARGEAPGTAAHHKLSPERATQRTYERPIRNRHSSGCRRQDPAPREPGTFHRETGETGERPRETPNIQRRTMDLEVTPTWTPWYQPICRCSAVRMTDVRNRTPCVPAGPLYHGQLVTA